MGLKWCITKLRKGHDTNDCKATTRLANSSSMESIQGVEGNEVCSEGEGEGCQTGKENEKTEAQAEACEASSHCEEGGEEGRQACKEVCQEGEGEVCQTGKADGCNQESHG